MIGGMIRLEGQCDWRGDLIVPANDRRADLIGGLI